MVIRVSSILVVVDEKSDAKVVFGRSDSSSVISFEIVVVVDNSRIKVVCGLLVVVSNAVVVVVELFVVKIVVVVVMTEVEDFAGVTTLSQSSSYSLQPHRNDDTGTKVIRKNKKM